MRRATAPAPTLTGVRGDDQKGRPRTALGALGGRPVVGFLIGKHLRTSGFKSKAQQPRRERKVFARCGIGEDTLLLRGGLHLNAFRALLCFWGFLSRHGDSMLIQWR